MLNPLTGPWSVMKRLVEAQQKSGRYAAVGLGVITPSDWPSDYELDLQRFEWTYRRACPKLPGTLQNIYQMLVRPGIEGWLSDFASRSAADAVVVHCHNAWTSGVFFPLRPIGMPVKQVVTFHGVAGESVLLQQPVRRWIHRRFSQRLDSPDIHLTSVDKRCPGTARRLFGLSEDKFSIVPNGMPFSPGDGPDAGAGDGGLVIAHVGTLNADKGWRIAADAVVRLAAQGYDVKLVIAGGGPDEISAKTLALQHPGIIDFRGHVRDPLSAVLHQADLFVLMTNNDGQPMAIIEAMSCGVPVISTRIGGIPDTVVDSETGCLIDRSVDSLADTIVSFIQTPGKLARYREATMEHFKRTFEISSIVSMYDAIYQA